MSGSPPISSDPSVARTPPTPDVVRQGGIPHSILLAPLVASLLVGALAGTLLAIWFVAPSMKHFSSGIMKANTATGLGCSAVALWLMAKPTDGRSSYTRLGRWLAAAALAIGASTTIEYLFGWDLGIDQILVSDFPNPESRLFPGRMSPIAATCFCLLGAALLSLDVRQSKRGFHLPSAFGIPLLLVNIVAITGYLYDVRNFYQLGAYIRIAWPTALCFIALGVGTLMARPDAGLIKHFTSSSLAGASSRRLLPAVVALPLAFGWLRLWAQNEGYVGLELGTALFAVSLVVVLCYVVWMDARALGNAEREREQSAGLFRSFFSLGLVGMGQTDARTGKLLQANSKLEEITGYSREELEHMRIADITYEADRPRDEEAFAEMVAGTRTSYSTEKRYVHKDGRIVWALVNVAKVQEPFGEPRTAVAVIQDITFLKEAQDKLEKALRLREEFLSIASHELKTPLTALLMQIQGLQRLVAHEPALARYENRLRRAAASALRLEKLIVQLLDVSRLTEGRLLLEPEPLDLTIVVEDVVSRFREAAEKAHSPIDVVETGPVEGAWDRMRIDQVLTNLVSNALKYGAGQPVDVIVRKTGDEAFVSVRDRGIGIAKDDHDRIFQRFERGVETRSYGGFGLGLWIAMQVARASGGTIDVESVLGEGATFTLRLPLRPVP